MNKLAQIILEDANSVNKKINLSELLGKKILITGASGMVGTYLLASLKNLADKNPGKIKTFAVMQNFPLSFQKFLLNYKGAKILKGDLTDCSFLKKIPKVDYIIHAAGYAQPSLFLKNQDKTIYINTATTLMLFEKLLPNGKFLFISSSEIYSGLTYPPYKENSVGTTNTDHPRSCYIESKKCGEAICAVFKNKGVNAKSVRLSLAYGPGTKPNDQRVLNSFIQKGIKNKKIELMDRGEAKRTYCYITDSVEIIWKVLLFGQELIYNGGGNSKTAIGQLAREIGRYLNIPVYFPKSSANQLKGAPENVRLDMTKFEKEFGKINYTPLKDGLKKTIEWQKELYKI
jgi:nucleoside-diphosphate-sugar epimerase